MFDTLKLSHRKHTNRHPLHIQNRVQNRKREEGILSPIEISSGPRRARSALIPACGINSHSERVDRCSSSSCFRQIGIQSPSSLLRSSSFGNYPNWRIIFGAPLQQRWVGGRVACVHGDGLPRLSPSEMFCCAPRGKRATYPAAPASSQNGYM